MRYDCHTAMNLGFGEMLFLVLLALILFGPRRLPEIARQMGKFMAEFRRASSDFQNQIHDEVRKLELDEAANQATTVTEALKPANPEDDLSISGALDRLTERLKTGVPRDYDA